MMKAYKRICALALVLTLVISLFAACGKPSVQEQIIGSWRDSTGIIGFDFGENGAGKIVAGDFTIPVINISLKGDYDMTYSIETGENDVTKLHISFTFAVPINLDFTMQLDGDILRLTHDSGLNYTLTRVVEADTSAAADGASEAVSE